MISRRVLKPVLHSTLCQFVLLFLVVTRPPCCLSVSLLQFAVPSDSLPAVLSSAGPICFRFYSQSTIQGFHTHLAYLPALLPIVTLLYPLWTLWNSTFTSHCALSLQDSHGHPPHGGLINTALQSSRSVPLLVFPVFKHCPATTDCEFGQLYFQNCEIVELLLCCWNGMWIKLVSLTQWTKPMSYIGCA